MSMFDVEGWNIHQAGSELEVALFDDEGGKLVFTMPRRIAGHFARCMAPDYDEPAPTIPIETRPHWLRRVLRRG
jgi:hypothetical protein